MNATALQLPLQATRPSALPSMRPASALEEAGFELGWDHARHGLALPATRTATCTTGSSALAQGHAAGRAAFGSDRPAPGTFVRQWLELRLHAWQHGRSVEPVRVTPNYLRQIAASHCPVTREALVPATASIDRVRDDAGVAAGNLVQMSRRANQAKAAHGFSSALAIAERLEAEARPEGDGALKAAQWQRVAVLCSFVTPLPHAEAAALPLLVLPPNRLALFNPAQQLQAFVSRQLLTPGWARRARTIAELLDRPADRRAFQAFFHALLPRVLEASRLANRAEDTQRTRWAVEDAWRHPLVMKRWTALAATLGAPRCEALVRDAAAAIGDCVEHQTDAQATEGWQLATRGHVPRPLRAVVPRAPLAPRGMPIADTCT